MMTRKAFLGSVAVLAAGSVAVGLSSLRSSDDSHEAATRNTWRPSDTAPKSDILLKRELIRYVSAVHPLWLSSHKSTLLGLAAKSVEQELRWHLAQMLPRLNLDQKERRKSIEIMQAYLGDRSNIVKTFAMQALADFAINNDILQHKLLPQFEDYAQNGSPSMRARARKLILRLNRS